MMTSPSQTRRKRTNEMMCTEHRVVARERFVLRLLSFYEHGVYWLEHKTHNSLDHSIQHTVDPK